LPPLFDRMLRAAKLDVHLYEEVEGNPALMSEALLVVVIVAVALGIGSLTLNPLALALGVVFAVIGWALWAAVVYFVGTRLLSTPQTHADWGQVARCTAYAQSPGLLRVFGFIPILGPLIVFVAVIWQIICMVTGVRTALDYTSTGRAVAVVLIGFIPYLILYAILGAVFSPFTE
jgi:hypothetical protein